MIWSVCFSLSFAVLVGSCIWAFLVSRAKYKSHRLLTPVRVVSGGFMFSSVAAFFPIYVETMFDGSYWNAFLLSVHNTFRLFVVDGDFDFVLSRVPSTEWYSVPYLYLFAVLFVVSPFLTVGVVLSFFKNLSAYRKLVFSFFSDLYVFSDLSEKSLALAKDMREKEGGCVVFTDIQESNEEGESEELEQARELGAICFKKDIQLINFKFHSKKKKLYFFVIGENEEENLEQTLSLIEHYGAYKNAHLYDFSTGTSSELHLSKVNCNMTVRRVDEIRDLINHLLYDQGHRLFETAKEESDGSGTKLISAVVVGLGRYGLTMVKQLVSLCQLDGYRIVINAFEKDPLAEEKFFASCPELMDPNYNGVLVEGKTQYTVNIHAGIDVDTKSFADQIAKLDHATYVFVSLGSDEMNIRTAVNLRTRFDRISTQPIIQTVVYNTRLSESLKGIKGWWWESSISRAKRPYKEMLKDPQALSEEEIAEIQEKVAFLTAVEEDPDLVERNAEKKRRLAEEFKIHLTYDIECVCDLSQTYSREVIVSSKLKEEGLAIHLRYSGLTPDDDLEKRQKAELSFWQYEYNYKSSVACALHLHLLKMLGVSGVGMPESEQGQEEQDRLKHIEHLRWNAYMRAEGYIYDQVRNDRGMTHNNLVSNENLSEEDSKKDRLVIYGSEGKED